MYSDLRGIDGLLSEMERSGVEFDAGTWQVLVRIGEERFLDMSVVGDGREAIRGKSWWERPEQVKWYARVGEVWKQVVAERLRERGLGEEISEREYGDVVPAEDGAQSVTNEGTVWL